MNTLTIDELAELVELLGAMKGMAEQVAEDTPPGIAKSFFLHKVEMCQKYVTRCSTIHNEIVAKGG